VGKQKSVQLVFFYGRNGIVGYDKPAQLSCLQAFAPAATGGAGISARCSFLRAVEMPNTDPLSFNKDGCSCLSSVKPIIIIGLAGGRVRSWSVCQLRRCMPGAISSPDFTLYAWLCHSFFSFLFAPGLHQKVYCGRRRRLWW
jgi:hypothetical protein